MEKRKARIKDPYTRVNLFTGNLELGFVVQFNDDDSSFEISFSQVHKGDWHTLCMLLCMYFRRDTSCFLSELDNKEILVLQGERFGRIAFANPDILDKDKWVVVNARKKKLYTEDEAREILTSKNQSK